MGLTDSHELPHQLAGALHKPHQDQHIFKSQMKTAKKATGAGNYLVGNSFQLTDSRDDYIRTTRSRRKIERDNSGDSGGSSVDSDGFGGSSGGKFY